MYIHTEFEYIKKIKTNFLQHENMFGNVYKNIFRYSWYIKKKCYSTLVPSSFNIKYNKNKRTHLKSKKKIQDQGKATFYYQ